MTDTTTLLRAVGELVQDLIDHAYSDGVEGLARPSEQTTKALNALFAALAEPEPTVKESLQVDALRRWANANEDAPETEFQRGYDAARRWVREVALPALAEPEKERAEVAAPARSGVGAGQTNAPTGEAYRTPEPDAKREPATDVQVTELCKAKGIAGKWSCLDYHTGWRDAERFHGIR